MSDLRDTIARAIVTSREFAAASAFGVPIDAKTEYAERIADAVIAALDLAEERIYQTRLCDPEPRIILRYVTDWTEET